MKTKTTLATGFALAFSTLTAGAMEIPAIVQSLSTSFASAASATQEIGAASSRAQARLGFPARVGTAMMAAQAGDFDGMIRRHASENGVPLALAYAVVRVESAYRPNVRGSAGEVGLMQIKPATARLMGYRGGVGGLFDPETNIRFGMKYLGMAHRLGGGPTCRTILKYNAGHAAKRMNPVSRAYCDKVLAYLAG
ncbi:MAG: transglycosylase SLT domain-containing protein [Rhizobiaceae bacterium]|nr:transglycosylase SLT domain-containing protein [Rhizobiaceae bacterium]